MFGPSRENKHEMGQILDFLFLNQLLVDLTYQELILKVHDLKAYQDWAIVSHNIVNNLGLFSELFSVIGHKWINLGPFKISFSIFWLREPKYRPTQTDLKKSQICPIWGQSDPIWMPNLTSMLTITFVLCRFEMSRGIFLL